MRISFYAGESGLGNNGGTRTIIRCAEILELLGHEVSIVSRVDNFTWFPHPESVPTIPECDAIVAVSVVDVPAVLNSKIEKKFWYMRGWETWSVPQDILITCASKINMIVNSTGLQRQLDEFGISSELCFAGIDFGEFGSITDRKYQYPPRIGFLYHHRHKTKRFDRCLELVEQFETEYYSFGTGKYSNDKINYLQNPSLKYKLDLYNNSDIWFAPTESEGFHNPPYEAALCGSLIVCSDHPNNGMHDYCNAETAMMYHTMPEAIDIIKHPDYSKVDNMKKLLYEKIGTREKNMEKLISLIDRV